MRYKYFKSSFQFSYSYSKKGELLFHIEQITLVFKKVKRAIRSCRFLLKERCERIAPVALYRATRAIRSRRSLRKERQEQKSEEHPKTENTL